VGARYRCHEKTFDVLLAKLRDCKHHHRVTGRRLSNSGAGTFDRFDFCLYGDPTSPAYGTPHDSEVDRPGFPEDLDLSENVL
jgi:hypothetical protein